MGLKGTSEIFPTIRLLEERQQFVNKRLSLKLGPQEGKQSVGWNKIQSKSLDVCFSHLVFPFSSFGPFFSMLSKIWFINTQWSSLHF